MNERKGEPEAGTGRSRSDSDGDGARAAGGVLDYRCRCGKLRARITVETRDRPRRAVCHCRDCQTFQHALGTAERVLDANGGTEILMVSPASIAFVRGREHLAVLRLYPKGLLRWYAGCCDTPLGNTPAAYRIPHFGLIAPILHDVNGEGALANAAGAVRERIFGSEAIGGPPPGAHRKVPLRAIPPILAALAGRLRRGDHHRSPFFDADGEPTVTPRVLTELERRSLPPSTRV